MAAQSHTPLPAAQVGRASSLALAALLAEREVLRGTIERAQLATARRQHPWLQLFLTDAGVLARWPVPEHLDFIPNEFRANDEAVLRALRDLAQAAVDANPAFTIQMTADDFRLVSTFYAKKE